MATQIKLRRDTAANWNTNNTVVLAAGEIGVDLTNGAFKLGNGISIWSDLDYFEPGASAGSNVTTGTTAPSSPELGDLWYDTVSGRMYVYYDSTWVDANPVSSASSTATNELVNGDKTVSLGTEGKLTLPAGTTYEYLAAPLTGHGDGLARLDFTLVTDGVVTQWAAASASPAGSGYSIGDTFTFNAAFLGIPGASVTIEVLTVGAGGGVEDLAFSMPPLYPADIYRDSPINLQVGPESNRWTFGATGTLTLPGDLHVGNSSIREDGLFSDQFSIAAGAGKHVEVSSNDGGKVWSFDTDGNITLPAGGDVVDSTSVSQLAKRVEGSWTVTAGTNNYSFEVPTNGAYQLWVRGNIPNGIISYIATVHVTNANVPVIGSQRGYNYTDGGSPLLLTSMPSQFVGTEGTITTASIAGTTNNIFVFGISNASGASQTIYYGWVKI